MFLSNPVAKPFTILHQEAFLLLKLFPLRLDIVYGTIIIGMRGIMMHPVEKHRDLVLVAEEYLRVHPETGFREEITCKYLAENFEKLSQFVYP